MTHQTLSPVPCPPSGSMFRSPFHSHSASFPIIAVAIIGIVATGLLLVSYYVFAIKCCLNWHRVDLLRRFSLSRRRRVDDPLTVYSPALESRGLHESVIRSIPVFQYKKDAAAATCECAVCLNEFQETEKLRIIPNCGHVFHIDCIDIWLQSNANCPLCRNIISTTTTPLTKLTSSIMIAPISTPFQDPILNPTADAEDDYVVIEINTHDRRRSQSLAQDSLVQPGLKMGKSFTQASSFGDECIDIRKKDDQFAVNPIRRSFSMNSAADRQLYLAVQEMVQTQTSNQEESCSRVKRSFFSFGQGRGSRNAVQPVHLEP